MLFAVTADAANILILHAGALGDCILTLALADGFKAVRPGVEVSMAARSGIIHWAKDHKLLQSAYSLERLGLHALYQADGTLRPETAESLQRFDRIVSFLGDGRQAVSRNLVAALGSRVISIDPRPTEATLRTGRHIIEQWADELRGRGWKIMVDAAAGFPIVPAERDACRRQLADIIGGTGSQALILCHPGSGGLAKCVSIDVLQALVEELGRVKSNKVAWIIGPDEIERFGDEWRSRLERTAPVVCEESIAAAADLVCGADAYIGHDAGMTHLAALAGVCTIAIYGPTNPSVWGPLGPRCSVIPFPPPEPPIDPWIDSIVRVMPSAGGDRRSNV